MEDAYWNFGLQLQEFTLEFQQTKKSDIFEALKWFPVYFANHSLYNKEIPFYIRILVFWALRGLRRQAEMHLVDDIVAGCNQCIELESMQDTILVTTIDVTAYLLIHDQEHKQETPEEEMQRLAIEYGDLYCSPYVEPHPWETERIVKRIHNPKSSMNTISTIVLQANELMRRISEIKYQTFDDASSGQAFVQAMTMKIEYLMRVITIAEVKEMSILSIGTVLDTAVRIKRQYRGTDEISNRLQDTISQVFKVLKRLENEYELKDGPLFYYPIRAESDLLKVLRTKRLGDRYNMKQKMVKISNRDTANWKIKNVDMLLDVNPDQAQKEFKFDNTKDVLKSTHSGLLQVNRQSIIWLSTPKDKQVDQDKLEHAVFIKLSEIRMMEAVAEEDPHLKVGSTPSSPRMSIGFRSDDLSSLVITTDSQRCVFFPIVRYDAEAIVAFCKAHGMGETEGYIDAILTERLIGTRHQILEMLLKEENPWIDTSASLTRTLWSMIHAQKEPSIEDLERLYHSCVREPQVGRETLNYLQSQWTEAEQETQKLRVLMIVDRLLNKTLMPKTDPLFMTTYEWLKYLEEAIRPFDSRRLLEVVTNLHQRARSIFLEPLTPLNNTSISFNNYVSFLVWQRYYNIKHLVSERRK
ncbi:hypothetical protein EDD86DRAFT_199944, partial [Gorgonomyces haynaldii]